MSQVVRAIYENGVLRPLGPVELQDQEQVHLTIDVVETSNQPDGEGSRVDPLSGVRAATGIADLAHNFDDYRFGQRQS